MMRHEAVGRGGRGEPVEQAFNGVAQQHELDCLPLRLRVGGEASSDGRSQVPRAGQSRASRYGRITFRTRQTCA